MIYLRLWRAVLKEMPQEALARLSQEAAPRLRAILRPALETQAAILGIAPELLERRSEASTSLPVSSTAIAGEVYTDGKALFVVKIVATAQRPGVAPNRRDPEQTYLQLFYVGVESNSSNELVLVSALNRIFAVELARVSYESTRFRELQEEGRTSPSQPEQPQIEAAYALGDRHVRTLAVAIRSTGGLLVRDLAKQLPAEARDRTAKLQQELQSHGLVHTQIVVICKRSQIQIARVPSREVLISMSSQGVRCACGCPVADEAVEEALIATDLCQTLLDGSKWLTLLLLEELVRVGVPLSQTLIEQQVGGDEVDCLAALGGELVFFELKDKDFNLGNAYSFGAKLGIIRPDHAVIFSTQKVGGDAREHFERSRLARSGRNWRLADDEPELRYIEGLENLRSGIESMATSINSKDAIRAFRDVLSFAAIGSGPLLSGLERHALMPSAVAGPIESAEAEEALVIGDTDTARTQ